MKPSQYFSITSASKYPKEAAMFIDFFTNDIEANKILGGERGVPIATKVATGIKPSLNKKAVESFTVIERGNAYATKLPPNDPITWTTILTQIFGPKVVDPIMNGLITPEEGVALFRREASQVLAGGMVPDSGVPMPSDGGGTPDGGAPDAPAEMDAATTPDAAVEPDAATTPDMAVDTPPPNGRALFVVGALPVGGNDIPIEQHLAGKAARRHHPGDDGHDRGRDRPGSRRDLGDREQQRRAGRRPSSATSPSRCSSWSRTSTVRCA